MEKKSFQWFIHGEACYEKKDFKPLHVTPKLLKQEKILYPLTPIVEQQLEDGYQRFMNLYQHHQLFPTNHFVETFVDPNEELEVHNYTGMCPKNVLEVTPSSGSCSYACQYCLVTDGKQCKPISVFTNYTDKLKNSLERNKNRNIFYYFSPKTDAFSDTHLTHGIAHDIVRTFVDHYQKYPDSKVRIFIASKAGMVHLNSKHKGDTLFSLLGSIASKIQYNGSIGIMPTSLRDFLEPNVASIEDRLAVLQHCQELGIYAKSVLAQPLIIPYLTEKNIRDYMQALSSHGIDNIKPEFLTTEIENLVLISQFINYLDPSLIGPFFRPYLSEDNLGHKKQRSRLAPNKKVCVEKMALIKEIASEYDVSVSICNWVKQELSKEAGWIASIDSHSTKKGYKCLGYQQKMFL